MAIIVIGRASSCWVRGLDNDSSLPSLNWPKHSKICQFSGFNLNSGFFLDTYRYVLHKSKCCHLYLFSSCFSQSYFSQSCYSIFFGETHFWSGYLLLLFEIDWCWHPCILLVTPVILAYYYHHAWYNVFFIKSMTKTLQSRSVLCSISLTTWRDVNMVIMHQAKSYIFSRCAQLRCQLHRLLFVFEVRYSTCENGRGHVLT